MLCKLKQFHSDNLRPEKDGPDDTVPGSARSIRPQRGQQYTGTGTSLDKLASDPFSTLHLKANLSKYHRSVGSLRTYGYGAGEKLPATFSCIHQKKNCRIEISHSLASIDNPLFKNQKASICISSEQSQLRQIKY